MDSTATRCGQEQVLKNVTVQETSCRQVVEDICEMEAGPSGAAVPVAGSCVSKEVEECGPVTRQEERFVAEEVCREIPIKDCKDVQDSAVKRSIGSTTGCTITEKASTRAFSWLKAPTSAFTFKTLLRHYDKQALTPRSLNVKLGPRHIYHRVRAAIRHYANQTARPL